MKAKIIDIAKRHHTIMIILRKMIFLKNRLKFLRYYFSKVDEKLIVFESYMGRSYSDSPKAIYLKLKNKGYKCIWIFKDTTKHDNTLKKIKYGSKEYYKYYAKAKYWITNSRLNEALLKKKNQIYIQLWHGTPLKKLGFDIKVSGGNAMNTIKDIQKKYKKDSKRYTYMISPSKYCTKIYKSAFNLTDKTIIKELGYPRNDSLFKKQNINKIKENLKIPKNKKIILYAPTWRDQFHTSNIGYTYTVNLNFNNFKDYIVLFRAHYFISNTFNFTNYKNVIDVSDYEDINDLYLISDVLITDYSSVFFDYANLYKPIIFYMYDYEEYKNKIRDFYIDINTLPGKIVFNEKDLIKAIKETNNFKITKKYKDFNNKYNYLNNKNTSEKVIEECIK